MESIESRPAHVNIMCYTTNVCNDPQKVYQIYFLKKLNWEKVPELYLGKFNQVRLKCLKCIYFHTSKVQSS